MTPPKTGPPYILAHPRVSWRVIPAGDALVICGVTHKDTDQSPPKRRRQRPLVTVLCVTKNKDNQWGGPWKTHRGGFYASSHWETQSNVLTQEFCRIMKSLKLGMENVNWLVAESFQECSWDDSQTTPAYVLRMTCRNTIKADILWLASIRLTLKQGPTQRIWLINTTSGVVS